MTVLISVSTGIILCVFKFPPMQQQGHADTYGADGQNHKVGGAGKRGHQNEQDTNYQQRYGGDFQVATVILIGEREYF